MLSYVYGVNSLQHPLKQLGHLTPTGAVWGRRNQAQSEVTLLNVAQLARGNGHRTLGVPILSPAKGQSSG